MLCRQHVRIPKKQKKLFIFQKRKKPQTQLFIMVFVVPSVVQSKIAAKNLVASSHFGPVPPSSNIIVGAHGGGIYHGPPLGPLPQVTPISFQGGISTTAHPLSMMATPTPGLHGSLNAGGSCSSGSGCQGSIGGGLSYGGSNVSVGVGGSCSTGGGCTGQGSVTIHFG